MNDFLEKIKNLREKVEVFSTSLEKLPPETPSRNLIEFAQIYLRDMKGLLDRPIEFSTQPREHSGISAGANRAILFNDQYDEEPRQTTQAESGKNTGNRP